MWGSAQTFNYNGAIISGPQVSPQIASVAFGRPDSWTFFFAATLTGLTGAPANAVRIDYNLQFGLGRSLATIPGFGSFTWTVGQLSTLLGVPQVTTQVQLAAENSSRTAPNLISQFPAETINCNAQTVFQGTNPGVLATFQLEAYFSPLTHHRAEWHDREPQFYGGEDLHR